MSDETGETRDAGRALDALIAERVMGWTDFVPRTATCTPEFDVTATPPRWDSIRYRRVPEYSTDIAAAWQVLSTLHGNAERWAQFEQALPAVLARFNATALHELPQDVAAHVIALAALSTPTGPTR